MKKTKAVTLFLTALVISIVSAGCSTTYVAKPMRFKTPSAYPNATEVADATIAAQAFADAEQAKEAFGFDIRAAGMLSAKTVFS